MRRRRGGKVGYLRQRGQSCTSESMRLVERPTRVDTETLAYEFTVTDPETWTSLVDGVGCRWC